LIDKNGSAIKGVKIYGDVARALPKQEYANDLKNLCKKYKENNK